MPREDDTRRLRSVAILDCDSIFFTALAYGLRPQGFQIDILSIEEEHLDESLAHIRLVQPHFVLVGQWAGPVLLQRMAQIVLVESPPWRLILACYLGDLVRQDESLMYYLDRLGAPIYEQEALDMLLRESPEANLPPAIVVRLR